MPTKYDKVMPYEKGHRLQWSHETTVVLQIKKVIFLFLHGS